MPRKARIDGPGALHHVIIRGIERRRIFMDDVDRDGFLERLGEVLGACQTGCFAWALLPNHAHFLFQTGTEPLATVMRRLLTGYVVTFNHRHSRHGSLFQNRYRSILCQAETYFSELVRYIHLNPLRAGVVPDMELLDRYPYTGHSAVMGHTECEWLDSGRVLLRFGKTVGKARERYRTYVESGIERGHRFDLVGGGLVRSMGAGRKWEPLTQKGNSARATNGFWGMRTLCVEY